MVREAGSYSLHPLPERQRCEVQLGLQHKPLGSTKQCPLLFPTLHPGFPLSSQVLMAGLPSGPLDNLFPQPPSVPSGFSLWLGTRLWAGLPTPQVSGTPGMRAAQLSGKAGMAWSLKDFPIGGVLFYEMGRVGTFWPWFWQRSQGAHELRQP